MTCPQSNTYWSGKETGNFKKVRIAGKPSDHLWDIQCRDGCIQSISLNTEEDLRPLHHPFIVPSLCHPHIHLDKCFLLSHPKFSDLTIKRGDFAEALSLTNEAKARFENDDLLERGRALIEESIAFGVTSMRAFVEVDLTVGLKCLEAGLALKTGFIKRCHIQICAFAQDPLFSYSGDKDSSETSKEGSTTQSSKMVALFRQAVAMEGVDVVGSTPYVEHNEANMKRNIAWVIDLAISHGKHVDFHLDYNLDTNTSPMVWHVIFTLKKILENWTSPVSMTMKGKDQLPLVTLGHCTRLTLFSSEEWKLLRDEIRQNDLPISLVGLPTSDMFMMGRVNDHDGCGQRVRGTLQILQMIKTYDLNCAIGVNNVGNAFTPQGNCDPLALASLGVGLYQAGTQVDAELLLECVSTRARKAIGLGTETSLELKEGASADFVVFEMSGSDSLWFRKRQSVHNIILDAGTDRMTFKGGKNVMSYSPSV